MLLFVVIGAANASASGVYADGALDGNVATAAVANNPPVAVIKVEGHIIIDGKITVEQNEQITFNGSDSYDPDGDLLSYIWDFGDGATENGEIVTHIYNDTGICTPKLTVDDTPAPLTGPRWLCAAPKASGEIGLSWRLDHNQAGYNIYRCLTSGSGYTRINSNLVTTTSYVDSGLTDGTDYYYVVRAVDSSVESGNSNEASATATSDSSKFNRVLSIDNGEDCWGRVGDLNNDGNIDFLFQKGAVYIRAYDHTGTLMWQKAMNSPDSWGHGSWKMHPQPTVIWDIDQDGKNEVICGNYYESGKYYVAIIDGATGNIKKKKELPAGILRLEVGSVANLRGTANPQDFVLSSTLGSDYTRRIYAFDDNLDVLWTWTNDFVYGEQCHRYKVGDVDYDGKDEVCVGEIMLNGDDGTVRWVQDHSERHQDSIEIVELDGNAANGREVLVGYDRYSPSGDGKLMCINGPTGTLRWERNYGGHHCVHAMEPYEFRTDHPGKEIFFYAKHIGKWILVKKDGSEIWKIDGSNEGQSIYWQGNIEADIITVVSILDSHANVISTRPEPHTSEMYLFISGDIIGDYREEYFAADSSGKIHLYSNVAYNPTSKKSFWETNPDRVWEKYRDTDDY
jgi:chitodextrinase